MRLNVRSVRYQAALKELKDAVRVSQQLVTSDETTIETLKLHQVRLITAICRLCIESVS